MRSSSAPPSWASRSRTSTPRSSKAQRAVGDLGGYIGASTRSIQDDHPVATVTYRVPVERWDDALVALRGLATEVLTEQTDAMEVTAQAVDLDARIKNLRATEAALQGVLEKAVKIPDILEVQAQLSTVREQIEVLVAQRTELGDRAALGTISVAYGVEVVAVTQATQSWDPAADVDSATATLVGILQGLASAGIWLAIVWLPVLAVLAIVVAIVALVLRRSGVLRRPGRGGQPPRRSGSSDPPQRPGRASEAGRERTGSEPSAGPGQAAKSVRRRCPSDGLVRQVGRVARWPRPPRPGAPRR